MERRGRSRRRVMLGALLAGCFVGAGQLPASAEDTTESAKRQLGVALAGWEDAGRTHRLDVSLQCFPRTFRGYQQTFPGLDVPPSTEGMPLPCEPMLLEGVVQGGEAALLHQAPAPLLAWYRGPGGTWLRALEPAYAKKSVRVRVVGGQEVALRLPTPGWPRGLAPDLPTLEQDLASTLDLAALRAWLLAATSLRRWERASGGTQIRAMARPTGPEPDPAWGAVRSIEITVELDPGDRLLSLALEVQRVGSWGTQPLVRGDLDRGNPDRGNLERWRQPYPRASLRDPNEVLESPAELFVRLPNPAGTRGPLQIAVSPGSVGSGLLTLVLRPRSAPTSRLMELFLARRRG